MTAGLCILDADIPEQSREWVHIWSEWPSREVSAHPSYLRLFRKPGERALAAIVREERGGCVLYPFILRPIPAQFGLEQLTDVTSAYGYGGPSMWGSASPATLGERFWGLFDDWAASQHVVSEFIRFGLFGEAHAWYPGEVVDRQPNIVVPVDVDSEVSWKKFEHKVRKNVNRARASAVEITTDLTGERISDFLVIYHSTLDRRDAAEGYYFPIEFFDRIHKELSGSFAYFHAHRDGEVISTELVLLSNDSVYSFLGGTNSAAFAYRPNDLLKYEVMRWAHSQGKHYFVLGGGVTTGDGIERYKSAFAPEGKTKFRTGQRVLMPDEYRALSEHHATTTASSDGFFPEYRS